MKVKSGITNKSKNGLSPVTSLSGIVKPATSLLHNDAISIQLE